MLPALLPFFICADFMVSLGIPSLIAKYFEKPFQKLFGTPGSSAFVFIISITSGYPVGAKIIGSMRRRGELTDREGISMLSFCSTSGPLFILGTVGVGMLHSAEAGAVIALSHYIAALLNGVVFRLFNGRPNDCRTGKRACAVYSDPDRVDRSKSVLELLTDSIVSSLKVLGIICCYIVIFVYLTDLLEMSGALNIFADKYSVGFFKGLIEMTIGVSEISAATDIGLRVKCALAAFLVSFGGICIRAQSMSVLKGLNIPLSAYLKIKISHGIIAGLLAYLCAPYLLNKAVLSVGLFRMSQSALRPGFLLQLLFSAGMIIIILILFIFTVLINGLISRRKGSSD